MVAPNYAEQRRTLAKTIGLGRKPKAATAASPAKRKPVATGGPRSVASERPKPA